MDSTSRTGSLGQLTDPDFDLVARAKKELPNRTMAFEALMRKYEKLLFRVCYRVMGDHTEAEDVFQEVLVKAYNGLQKFENRSSFKTWLFSIAHNTCYTSISKLAKAREFKAYVQQDSELDQLQSGISDAELESERMLSFLSREDRELLTLKFVVELNFEEIAQVCEIGVSAAKMRIYRAVEQVQKRYSET